MAAEFRMVLVLLVITTILTSIIPVSSPQAILHVTATFEAPFWKCIDQPQKVEFSFEKKTVCVCAWASKLPIRSCMKAGVTPEVTDWRTLMETVRNFTRTLKPIQ